jgi:hypothetical protein
MDSAPVGTGVGERCPERERHLREWTECGRRIAKLFEEHPVAMKSSEPNSAGFEGANSAGQGGRN